MRGAPEVFGEFPCACLAEEIETPGAGQIRAMITIAGNPAVSTPNAQRLVARARVARLHGQRRLYLNETTRHADVILPGLSPLEQSHFDIAFPQLSVRNWARYSPPVFEPPPGAPEEWQVLLRLLGVLLGQGPKPDVDALDDARDRAPGAGRGARAGLAARRARRRPRSSPRSRRAAAPNASSIWRCARAPTATSSARSRRALARPRSRRRRTASTSGRSSRASPRCCARRAARSSWRPSCCSPTWRGSQAALDAARAGPGAGRPPARALEQLLDAQPADAREGPRALHAAGAPRGRGRRGLAQRRRSRASPRAPAGRGAGGDHRRDRARRRQPAARLGPRRAGHAAARSPRSAPARTATCSPTSSRSTRSRARPC